jgi:coproporphyrinogen III oxidase-like Fe-S oxidoreductase
LNKENVKNICKSIKELNLSWATLSRVDRLDNNTLEVMKDSGCYELEIGVEAGSQKILDLMNKRITIQQIKEGLRLSYEAGINNKVFLIHGFPGENYETTMNTIELLEEVGQWIERTSLFRFVPLPGTYVYNNPKEFDIRGTINTPNWDGNWGKFHIHHNKHHWWGNDNDFDILNISFEVLYNYVENRWPSKINISELPKDRWQEQSKIFSQQFYKKI